MLRPWSQQARQLTSRRGTVAHLGNPGCCVHIHTGNLSVLTAFHFLTGGERCRGLLYVVDAVFSVFRYSFLVV